eukprot:UN4648
MCRQWAVLGHIDNLRVHRRGDRSRRGLSLLLPDAMWIYRLHNGRNGLPSRQKRSAPSCTMRHHGEETRPARSPTVTEKDHPSP